MFRECLQEGIISVLHSQGSKPLQIWEEKTQNGHISIVKDEETKSLVLEIAGQNCSTNYIVGPTIHKDGFGLKMPFLHILVKSLKRDFSFEVRALDTKRQRRRFKFGNWFKDTRVKSTVVCIKLGMVAGWNHFVFDFTKIVKMSYGTNLLEITHMVINANCRLKRIFFADKIYSPATHIPNEMKIFIQGKPDEKYKQEQLDEEQPNEEEDNAQNN